MDLNGYMQGSKVWVFQSATSFRNNAAEITEQLDAFIASWMTHGKEVEAAYELIEDVFIVVMANEVKNAVSGCAIDELTGVVRKLENDLGLSLFNRSLLYYLEDGLLASCSFMEVKNIFDKGGVNEDTIIYDISVNSIESYINGWKIPMKRSWVYKQLVLGDTPV